MKYIPEIDGLRALSIILVLLHHTQLPFRDYLYIGVPMFFVISGYLITQILVNNLSKPDYFKRFYIRRSLRIFPAYYFSIVLGILAFSLTSRPINNGDTFWIISCVLYFSNYVAIFTKETIWNLGHTWSLSVEEQFYLLFPFLIFLFGKDRQQLLKIFIGIVICSWLFRCFGFFGILPLKYNYSSLESNISSLVLGGIGYLIIDLGWKKLIQPYVRWGIIALSLVLVTIFLGKPLNYYNSELGDYLWFFIDVSAVGLAVLIILNTQINENKTLNRLLALKPMIYIGKLSYSLYLNHLIAFMVITWLHRLYFPKITSMTVYLLFTLVQIIAALALSHVSRIIVEKPFLLIKDKWKAIN